LRLEAERNRVNDALGHKGDVDMVSLSLIYRFAAVAGSTKVSEKPQVRLAEPVMPVTLLAPAFSPATALLTAPEAPALSSPTTAFGRWVKVKVKAKAL
jgi:OOP family OmpA-OmpF porin